MDVFTPAFRRLESDFLVLADSVWIDDSQLDVYSPLAGEILLRAVSEIEALATELYQRENPNPKPRSKNPKFDLTCLRWLEENWKLHRRDVLVSTPNLYLGNRVLNPLFRCFRRPTSERNTEKKGWRKAKDWWTYSWNPPYQAIKHDRANSYRQGTIRNALEALAAQYLLLVSWLDPSDELRGLGAASAHGMDLTFNSKLFSVRSTGTPKTSITTGVTFDADRKRCVVEIVPNQETFDSGANVIKEINENLRRKTNDIYLSFLTEKTEEIISSLNKTGALSDQLTTELRSRIDRVDKSAITRAALLERSIPPSSFVFTLRLNRNTRVSPAWWCSSGSSP